MGSLLGTAIGDAMGASREGRSMVSKHEIGGMARISHRLHYTDDTHMTIGVAESLIECHGVDGAHMAGRFIENYLKEPWRGYGPGPPRVFRLIESGVPWDQAASHIYHGGSFGNGAAMRVAPIGLFLWNNHAGLREAAYLSSIITHSHGLFSSWRFSDSCRAGARIILLSKVRKPMSLKKSSKTSYLNCNKEPYQSEGNNLYGQD